MQPDTYTPKTVQTKKKRIPFQVLRFFGFQADFASRNGTKTHTTTSMAMRSDPVTRRHPQSKLLKQKRQTINLAFFKYGVDEGDRTLDNGSHNPVLYQLSYAHHIACVTPLTPRQTKGLSDKRGN